MDHTLIYAYILIKEEISYKIDYKRDREKIT